MKQDTLASSHLPLSRGFGVDVTLLCYTLTATDSNLATCRGRTWDPQLNRRIRACQPATIRSQLQLDGQARPTLGPQREADNLGAVMAWQKRR
jgi:hypothetical protein